MRAHRSNYSEKDVLKVWKRGFRTVVVYHDMVENPASEFEIYLGTKGVYDHESNATLIPIPAPASLDRH